MKLTADYITSPDKTILCPTFKREFKAKNIKKAVLKITALGVYEAYINGKRVGNFFMAPGFTQYNERLQVQTYDVTDLIKEDNNISVTLAKGWACGRYAWMGDSGLWSKTPALIAQIELYDENGEMSLISTNTKWDVYTSNCLDSELYDGETYDARIEPQFSSKAAIYLHPKSILTEQQGEIICEHETVPAKEVIITPKGETVIDFGQNSVGYVLAQGVMPKDAVLEYDFAEILDKDGNFYTENMRSAKNTVKYVSNGNAFSYHPHFCFQGGRYIRIRQGKEYLKDLKFTYVIVYSDIKRTGYFECSDKLINKLYENIIWGQRGNFVDIPTDCPQRDERAGWTADTQVFCKTAAYNYNVKKFFQKWLTDLTLAQNSNGNVPHVVPDFFGERFSNDPTVEREDWGDTNYATGWGDAATIVPWNMYLMYGDRSFLETQFESMRGWVDFMDNESGDEHIFRTGGAFGDWLAMDTLPGTYVGATDIPLIGTAFFAYSTSLLIKAGKIIGKDITYYEKLYAQIKEAFNKEFIVGEDKLLGDTQTAYVLALHFDLITDKKPFIERLITLIKENGNRLNTGFLGTAYLMPVLSENGYTDIAYTLLLQQEFPSWLFSVNMGATTIWEHWDGLRPDGTVWSKDMNSFNHYAYGAVAEWMYGVMCGIQPDENTPGFENIIIAPKPDSRIEWAKASYDTGSGIVKSSWKFVNGKPEYEIVIPEGHTATITVNGNTYEVTAGEYKY